MARPNKIWFWEDRQAWFVKINGKRHNLGPDETEAKRQFHRIMAEPEAEKAPSTIGLTIADIFEKFLEWCEKHRSAGTYQWCKCRIQWFINHLGQFVRQSAESLKPFHVIEWTDKNPGWSPTYRHGLIAAAQRPFNWAVKLGYIDKNPIRFIEKPSVQRKDKSISPADWLAIRDRYPEADPFRALLEFSWETGCRPYEARRIELRHVRLAEHRIIFPKDESKGKKRERIIYMTPKAEEILKRLMERRTGLLFLNADNAPWTPFAINNRFCRLEKHIGSKVCQYLLRHNFATRKLEEGLAPATVAALMGHQDLEMLSRVYGHLDQADEHLKQAAGH